MNLDDSPATLPLVLLGGGGHAKVLLDALLLTRRHVLGFTDLETAAASALSVPRLGGDDAVLRFMPSDIRLVNGMGSIGSTASRRDLFERFRTLGYQFDGVVHPSAVIAPGVVLDEGVQVMAGAILQTGVHVGANAIINTAASVDHDCRIGDNVQLAPGAILCGGVRVGVGAHVGAGAVVIQGVTIGDGAIVGAGAVVVRDVPSQSTVVGVPAREIRRLGAD